MARSSPYDGRTAVVTSASALDSAAGVEALPPSLSRGQRKRNERKLHKLGKWESATLKEFSKTKESKAVSKAKLEKKESSMLSDFERVLKNEAEVVIKPASASLCSNKMKREIALREAERMKAVQEHPDFLANPIAAMHAHLAQMLALRESASNPVPIPRDESAKYISSLHEGERAKLSASHEKRMRRKEKAKMEI